MHTPMSTYTAPTTAALFSLWRKKFSVYETGRKKAGERSLRPFPWDITKCVNFTALGEKEKKSYLRTGIIKGWKWSRSWHSFHFVGAAQIRSRRAGFDPRDQCYDFKSIFAKNCEKLTFLFIILSVFCKIWIIALFFKKNGNFSAKNRRKLLP
jgi:hypothetical protein